MATNYSFNVDSPFLQRTQPKPGDRTSSNPYGLSFGGGYSDAYTKMKDRFNQQVTADLKSKHSFLDDKSINKLNPLKLVKKGAEVFGKTMTIAEPFLHKDEIPENKNAQLSNSIGNSIANYATTLGPWGWGYKGLHALAQSTGGMLNGSNTENKVTDGLNTLLGAVPGLGWFVSKSPSAYRNAMVESSAMYGNTNLFAQEHGGGKYAINRAGINSRIKQDNINTAVVAKHILEPAKRDFSADIAMVAQGINTALTGDVDRVTNFGPVAAKQGAVLQFTKRTLSKHKIKKQQDGGKVQQGRTLDELVDYVEQQNPPFWERMSGQDRNYIANDDGSVSSLRMTYSEGKEEPYVDVYPQVQYDLNGNLKYYFDPNEAYTMAKLRNDIVRMSREEAKRFTEGYKDSTKLKSYYRNYHPTQVKLPKEAWNWEYKTLNGSIPENEEIIEEFKEGGKVNVIPEGALHKNKHHLEEVDEKFEDVTTKGIPVIVESEDGEVIQQAEVEREEIIFRLEVTKKLEELSRKHTDEAAIEAGKLLVKEILYNTEDNTGKMI